MSRPTQQKKIVTHSVVPSQYMPVYSENGQEVMISIAEFISSLGIDTDVEGYLPLTGGTMTGTILNETPDGRILGYGAGTDVALFLTNLQFKVTLQGAMGPYWMQTPSAIAAVYPEYYFANEDESSYYYFDTNGHSFLIAANQSFSVNAGGASGISYTVVDETVTLNGASTTINLDEEVNITLDATLGKLGIQNMKTFANNAAALAGSLAAGDVYKTASGELRIVV